MTVALISTDAEYLASDDDTELDFLAEAINSRGLNCEVVVWHEPRDWSRFDALVLKSPWDYHLRLEEFQQWFHHVATQCRILNPPEVVWWNIDKQYLNQFTELGVACVPTVFCHDEAACLAALAEHGSAAVVVKPTISNGSRFTGLFHANDDQALQLCREILAQQKVVMVQPEIPEIAAGAERGLLFFNGALSHAITKGPILQLGGGYLGGRYIENITPAQPTRAERSLGEAAMAAITQIARQQGWGPDGETLLYARIDVVTPEGRDPILLEAELFEPSLFLRTSPGAVDRYIDALAAKLG